MRNLLVMLFIVCFVAACANDEGQNEMTGQNEQTTKNGGALQGDTAYLARIGNVVITEQDLTDELKVISKDRIHYYMDQDGRERLLGEMVKKEMLYKEARELGIDKKPEYAMQIEHLKKMALVEMLLASRLITKMDVTEEEIVAYYNKHLESEFTDMTTGIVIELDVVRDLLEKQIALEKHRNAFNLFIAELTKKYRPEIKGVVIEVPEELFGK